MVTVPVNAWTCITRTLHYTDGSPHFTAHHLGLPASASGRTWWSLRGTYTHGSAFDALPLELARAAAGPLRPSCRLRPGYNLRTCGATRTQSPNDYLDFRLTTSTLIFAPLPLLYWRCGCGYRARITHEACELLPWHAAAGGAAPKRFVAP